MSASEIAAKRTTYLPRQYVRGQVRRDTSSEQLLSRESSDQHYDARGHAPLHWK